jgi:tetratricopeptide (TPR) repeat protein
VTAVIIALSIFLGLLSYERNKVWQNPIALWQDASRYAPGRQWVWNNLGREFLEAERFEEAREALERAEELGESTAALHLNLGVCLMEEGDLDGAEQRFNLARAMAPDRPEVLVALARLNGRRGKHFVALDFFSAAWQMGLWSPELILERAKVELLLKHVNRARKVLEEGRKIFPKNGDITRMLESLEE